MADLSGARALGRLAAVLAALVVSSCSAPRAWLGSQAAEPVRPVPPSLPRALAPLTSHAIVQEGFGHQARFVLVAAESNPTPKTLALPASASAPELLPSAPVATPERRSSDPIVRTSRVRVRQPAGAVYFGAAEATLAASAMPTVAAAARRTGPSDRLVLTAYTDPRGPLQQNARLAGQRADSVSAALVSRGVDPGQLIVLSRPQCCVGTTARERDYATYRRVDIEILTTQAHASEEGGDGHARHS